MKNLRKMFLITTLVLLLVGITAVSAEEITGSDATNQIALTTSTSDVVNEQINDADNTETIPESNTEGDIDIGTTSVVAEPIYAVADEKFNFSAMVVRNIPGLQISEGQVEFTTEGVSAANVKANVVNGTATVEYTAPEEWVGQTIPYTAKFLGTENFSVSKQSSEITVVRERFDTTTTMEEVLGELNKPITLTARVISSTGDPVTGGQVIFVTTADVIGEDDVAVKYVDVKDGVAKYETVAQESWLAEGDVNTIEAHYLGTPDFVESESQPVALRLYNKTYLTTTIMNPVKGVTGQKINLTANVDIDEEGMAAPAENGFVYFVVDDALNITDNDGNVIYASVDNGIATVEVIANSSWINILESTVKAIYGGVGPYNSSVSEPVSIVIVDDPINTITTMEPVNGIYGELVTLTATVTAEDNSVVNEGDVSFLINGKIFIDDLDHGLDKLSVKVTNGVATVDVVADRAWDDDGDILTIQAIYEGEGSYLSSNSTDVAMNLIEKTPSPSPKVIPQKQKAFVQETKKVTNDKTFKVLVNDNVVYTGNVITLETLNNIFDKDFTNGILVVYLDGKVVFNGTTTDDLTLVIIQIIESLIGEHELKVEFTDSNNETNTFVKNITIN